MAEERFRRPGSNIIFYGAIPPLVDYFARVARMAEAFETGSQDLRDIRMADVISGIGDLYGRAREYELGATLAIRRAGDPDA